MANKIETLQLLAGVPIHVEELGIVIHQPTIEEIAFVGEDNFFKSLSLLNVKKDSLELEEEEKELLRDVDILYMALEDNEIKFHFDMFLGLILKDYDYEFLDNNVIHIFREVQDRLVLDLYVDDHELQILREYINEMFVIGDSKEEEDFNPQSDHARRIAEQIKEGRRKVEEAKRRQAGKAEEVEQTKDLFSNMVSVIAVGSQTSLKTVLKYTVYQLYDQMARLSKYEVSKAELDLAKFGGVSEITDWREDLDLRK